MDLHLRNVDHITPQSAGWEYTGLRIVTLGDPVTLATGGDEYAIVPLAGHGTVEAEGETLTLNGRESVFADVTDFAYVPRDAELRLTGEGRFATRSSSRAATTARASPRPATTSTTSTCSPAPASPRSHSQTTPRTTGCATRGPRWRPTRASR